MSARAAAPAPVVAPAPAGAAAPIAGVEVRRYAVELDPPFHAAWDPVPRATATATLVIVRTEDGVAGYASGDDVPALLALSRRGRLPLDRLVGERLPLDAVGDAFARLSDGGIGRVVLDLAGAAA